MQDAILSKQLRENYDGYYAAGDSRNHEWRRLSAVGKARNIVRLCRGLPHDRVLEIGAGDGAVLARLAEVGFGRHLHALEISTSGVEAIRQRAIPTLNDCQLFDGYKVPYADRRFDIAVLSHVVEHVEHPRLLLYEAARVARYVFVEVPLEDTLRLPWNFEFTSVGHINFYSPKTIRRLVQSSGMKILSQIVTNQPKSDYLFEKGKPGLVNYYTKQFMVKYFPGVATRLFTYHAALVCERAGAAPA